jgi:hypothetical protein
MERAEGGRVKLYVSRKEIDRGCADCARWYFAVGCPLEKAVAKAECDAGVESGSYGSTINCPLYQVKK